MSKIILVRHGESLGNKNHVFLGHTDLDLTERGYRQAELTADYLEKEYNIDIIYSSDLQRAVHTVEAFAKRKNLTIHKEQKLREVYAGYWESLTYNQIDEKYHDAYHVWKNDFGNAVCTGGESIVELQKRITDAIFEIRNKHPEKNILIGTHAAAIRAFKGFLSGYTPDMVKNIPWGANASVTVIDAESMKIILDSYAEHLGDEYVAPSKKV